MKPDRILNFIFYISMLLFFIGFNFKDNPSSGWQSQIINGLGGRSISDIFFLDSANGWLVTGYRNYYDTAFILRTTNGGYNWMITDSKYQESVGYNKVFFIDENTGFVCGKAGIFRKTINGGYNWVQLNIPVPYMEYFDMSILNEDTIWLVSSSNPSGGVFRTTNGGNNWMQQYSAGHRNPNKIYMFNSRIGFIGGDIDNLKKTTDGGFNWFTVLYQEFNDIYFIDSLIGWICYNLDSIKKTTDGGLTWFKILLPPTGGFYSESTIKKLSVLNEDTIYGVGARTWNINYGFRGLIYKTTNGGINWGYQFPDYNQINIGRYKFLKFLNYNTGWAYYINSGIHTISGGDTTIYTGTGNEFTNESPVRFSLYQNYPNPFNQLSIINFQCSIGVEIKIKVYDIAGKEVRILLDGYKPAGTYSIRFDSVNLPSGIYFYRMGAGNFSEAKKMIIMK